MLPATLSWRAQDTAAIAALQTLGAAGSLTLNGTLSLPIYGQNILTSPLAIPQNVRVVTLTSANNLSAVNFTITGMSGGVAVAQTIAGPNANTVSTTSFFSSVTSITTSAAAAAVSAGIGTTGFITLTTHNYNASVFNLGISTIVTNGGGALTYSFYVSDAPLDTLSASSWVANSFTPIAGMTAATTSQMANYTTPVKYSFINVTASSAAASLVEYLIQQGIRS